MTIRDGFEIASYAVTVVGLPFAIAVFIWERRKERETEQEEIYQRLSDEYTNFMKLVLDNADLRLLRPPGQPLALTPEQAERRLALFSILVALFERAYLLVYEERMSPQVRRLWLSWEDYMREWCARREFRDALPEMLRGEDEQFSRHIAWISAQEERTGENLSANHA